VAGGKKQIVKSSAFSIKPVGMDKIGRSGTYFVEITAISDYAGSGAYQVQMKLV